MRAKVYVTSKIYMNEKNESFKGDTIDNNKAKREKRNEKKIVRKMGSADKSQTSREGRKKNKRHSETINDNINYGQQVILKL